MAVLTNAITIFSLEKKAVRFPDNLEPQEKTVFQKTLIKFEEKKTIIPVLA